MSGNAALLWTGGKDCTLALCRARDAGLKLCCFATFFPEGDATAFKAHPIARLQEIAVDAQIPLELIPVREPYRESYVRGLLYLKDTRGIDSVVTGDIDLVEGRPNWIRQCTEGLAIAPIMPLWKCPREELLREVIARGIIARISWINSPHIPQQWLGRPIDFQFVADISSLAKRVPIDICGENGEYHTMVAAVPRE